MDIKNPFGGRKGSGQDEAAKNIIRYGTVSSVNSKLHTVRVAFADKSGVISHSLPMLVPGSLKNKYYHLPDVGEDVLCLFLPNSIQRGFVVGSFYNVNNAPPVISGDKDHVTYSDGTVVEYDRSTQTMTVNCKGTVNVTAASGVNIIGNVTVKGNIAVTGGITATKGITVTGNMATSGSITASGNVTAGGITLESHTHSGVQSGSSNTGAPNA